MDLAAPTSWAEAGLDTAGPLDRAPLLAIWGAIAERVAVAGGTAAHAALGKEPAPCKAQVPSEHFFYTGIRVDIIEAIRDLQERFFNPNIPYADTGWSSIGGYPSELHVRLNVHRPQNYGISPYDALALIPPVPYPAPGDSTVSAATRAFYAWCRASLDQMETIYTTVDVDADGMAPYASGYYDASDELYFDDYIGIPNAVYVHNPAPFSADARLVASAIDWPSGEWSVDRWTANRTFDAFGLTGRNDPGPSTTAIHVGPDASANIALGGRGPIASPPGVPGPDIPSASGYHEWQITCGLSALLDYSGSFRFHADISEGPA